MKKGLRLYRGVNTTDDYIFLGRLDLMKKGLRPQKSRCCSSNVISLEDLTWWRRDWDFFIGVHIYFFVFFLGRLDLMKKGLRLYSLPSLYIQQNQLGRLDLMKKGLRPYYVMCMSCKTSTLEDLTWWRRDWDQERGYPGRFQSFLEDLTWWRRDWDPARGWRYRVPHRLGRLDLMKKGLRQRNGRPLMARCHSWKTWPDEEGIETHSILMSNIQTIPILEDLTWWRRDWDYEKSPCIPAQDSIAWKTWPDEEGIETCHPIFNTFPYFILGRLDLMKKGLRPLVAWL